MNKTIVSLEQMVYVNMDDDATEEEILEAAAETFNEEEWTADECKIVDVV